MTSKSAALVLDEIIAELHPQIGRHYPQALIFPPTCRNVPLL